MASKKKKNNPSPRLLPKILLLGVTLFLVFLVGEIVARNTFKKNLEATFFQESDKYYYRDREGIKRLIPNKVGHERLWNNEGRAEFRINSHGFRGKEIPVEPQEDAYRILFIGDSITLGGRLNESDVFISRLEENLNMDAEGVYYELINGGIGDIGLNEEIRILEEKGLPLQPKLVVLGLYLNDARPPVGFPEEEIYDHPLIKLFNHFPKLRKSYLFGLIYDNLRSHLSQEIIASNPSQNIRFRWIEFYKEEKWREDPREFKALVRLAEYDWGNAWTLSSRERMLGLISEMKTASEKKGARFMVMMFPVQAQIYATHGDEFVFEPQAWFSSSLKSMGIPFLDLSPSLINHRAKPIFYDQCHYTPLGNALVAETLGAFLKRKNLLN